MNWVYTIKGFHYQTSTRLRYQSSENRPKDEPTVGTLIRPSFNYIITDVRYSNLAYFFFSYLLPTTDRSSKQKTPVCRKTICPRWEQTLRWDDLTLTDLTNSSLELTVWDHDRLPGRHSECLGGARFNLGTGKRYSGDPHAVQVWDSVG